MDKEMKSKKVYDKMKMKSREGKKGLENVVAFYKYLMNLYMSLDDRICFVFLFMFFVFPILVPFNKTTIVMIKHYTQILARVTRSNFKGRSHKAHVKNVLKILLNNALL